MRLFLRFTTPLPMARAVHFTLAFRTPYYFKTLD